MARPARTCILRAPGLARFRSPLDEGLVKAALEAIAGSGARALWPRSPLRLRTSASQRRLIPTEPRRVAAGRGRPGPRLAGGDGRKLGPHSPSSIASRGRIGRAIAADAQTRRSPAQRRSGAHQLARSRAAGAPEVLARGALELAPHGENLPAAAGAPLTRRGHVPGRALFSIARPLSTPGTHHT